MRSRALALAPLVAAVLVYAGVVLPLRARARVAADAYRDVRRERYEVRAQLASIERRERARRQAALVFAGPGSAERGAAAVRRSVLATLQGARVSGVRLAVRPSGPAGGTSVHVSGAGPFSEAVRLAGDLVAPGSGLVLDHVRLDRRGERDLVHLDLEALALESAP